MTDDLSPCDDPVLPGRLERLRAELIEEAVPALDGAFAEVPALVELAYALRPPTHEGRAPAYGAILAEVPIDPAVLDLGPLDHELVAVDDVDTALARRFADGVRTFLVRDGTGAAALACFGRAMTREYDLVILQQLLDALIIQRDGAGHVRTYGRAGVVRWDGIGWYHEAPIGVLRDVLGPMIPTVPDLDLRLLLLFAVHELSPRRIGALLVWRADGGAGAGAQWERRHHRTPDVALTHPGGSAAIANAIAQTDGAAVFGTGCRLTALGVRLVTSEESKRRIDLIGGTRHTSALRYSYDDPDAVVVVVSEDGPVTVMHRGRSLQIDDDGGLIG